MSDRRCLVCICHNTPVVLTPTARSLMEIGFGDRVASAKAAHGFSEVGFQWLTGSPCVDALRNRAVRTVLELEFSHLLFLDADMVWPTDVLIRMLAHHAANGVVSGCYVQKFPPYRPVALRGGDEGQLPTYYMHDEEAVGTAELRAEQVVGMGCTLIPATVLAALGPRPFRYEPDEEGWPQVSEDVPFCRDVRAAGFGVWLDPTIECGHCGPETWTPAHAVASRLENLPPLPVRLVAAPHPRLEVASPTQITMA